MPHDVVVLVGGRAAVLRQRTPGAAGAGCGARDDPSGQKSFGFTTALVHQGAITVEAGCRAAATHRRLGDAIWLRAVGVRDKPRQHTLAVHGMAWRSALGGGLPLGGGRSVDRVRVGIGPGWCGISSCTPSKRVTMSSEPGVSGGAPNSGSGARSGSGRVLDAAPVPVVKQRVQIRLVGSGFAPASSGLPRLACHRTAQSPSSEHFTPVTSTPPPRQRREVRAGPGDPVEPSVETNDRPHHTALPAATAADDRLEPVPGLAWIGRAATTGTPGVHGPVGFSGADHLGPEPQVCLDTTPAASRSAPVRFTAGRPLPTGESRCPGEGTHLAGPPRPEPGRVVGLGPDHTVRLRHRHPRRR